MTFKSITQLFSVAFLGFVLVGCSSTPKSSQDDTAQQAKQEATEKADTDIAAAKREAAQRAAAELAAQKAELMAMIEGNVVNFDYDRSEIRPDDYELIKANADYLSLDESVSLTVTGHCDERGSREYNLALGERRANAVRDALIAEGISPERISVISFGEDKPVAEGHTEAAWQQNRRAEFQY